MKVKQLIEELKKFDGNMEVVYDVDDGYTTFNIDEVYKGNEFHDDDEEEVVIIF